MIFNYGEDETGKNVPKLANLYLNNNTMISNQIEKIYNLGFITSIVQLIYFNNERKIVDLGYISIPGQITNDMGNVIVGQALKFVITNQNGENFVDMDVNEFNEGIYNILFKIDQCGTYTDNGIYAGADDFINKIGIIIVKNTTEPVDPMDPIDPIDPIDPVDPDDPQKEKNIQNNVSASMKSTGIPFIAIILVFLDSLELIYRKK